MNEDYLWDKSGEADIEIQELENALQAFRYRETVPPALPTAQIVPFKTVSRRKALRFTMPAAAACLAFGLMSLGIWLQFAKDETGKQHEVVEVSTPQIETVVSNPTFAEYPVNSPVSAVQKPE